MKRFYTLYVLAALLALSAPTARAGSGTPAEKSGMARVLGKIGAFIDSATVRGIDRRYIGVPERPWQVMAKGNLNEVSLKMKSHLPDEGTGDVYIDLNYAPKVKTGVGSSVGAWIGYRGYGLGYLVAAGRQRGSNLTLSMGGAAYGLSLRLRSFNTDKAEVHSWGDTDLSGEMHHFDTTDIVDLPSPIRVHSMLIDGYYLLNGKHFSNSASYDQSTIQLRSAGSVVLGASYLAATARYDEEPNAFLVLLMNNIGRISLRQVSLGAGYAYNWVPHRRWLVSALAMPMVTAYNRLKVWNYDAEWNNPDDISEGLMLLPLGTKATHSRMAVNANARLSLVYNHSRWFASATGQWNMFHYHKANSSGRLTDWYVNAAIGYRL